MKSPRRLMEISKGIRKERGLNEGVGTKKGAKPKNKLGFLAEG